MKAFWAWVKDLLSSNGFASVMRVAMIQTLDTILAVFVTANIIYWVRGNNGIVDFAPQCSIIIGSIIVGKVAQAVVESKKTNCDKPDNIERGQN